MLAALGLIVVHSIYVRQLVQACTSIREAWLKTVPSTLSKMGYYIRDSCILMRWSCSLHFGQGMVVCGLDIENTVAKGIMNINEEVLNVIP